MDTTLKINIIMFLLIPITYYSILFMRIMWNIMIINYVSYAVAESEMKLTKNKGALNLRKMLYIIPPVIECLIFTEFGQSQAVETIQKGKSVFNSLSTIYKWESNAQDCLQPNLVSPTRKPGNRDQFWQDYYQNGFKFVAKKYAGYNLNNIVKRKPKRALQNVGLLS